MKNKYSSNKVKEEKKLVSLCCKGHFTVYITDEYDDFGKMYWQRHVRCDSCRKECEVAELLIEVK